MIRAALTNGLLSTDWPQEETEQASGSANDTNVHLWEESWDDDDAAEDFSKQLKYV
jgi:26 proteasome complex subunit DSS1